MLLHVTFLLWILNIHITIEASECFHGPENVAVKTGEKVRFTCTTNPNSRLRWSVKFAGKNDEVILTRGGQILPSFTRNYSVEASDGKLTLSSVDTSLHNAGRYICLELSTSKTASAELIVIESTPICISTQDTSSSILSCDVKYRGNWHPDIDLSIRSKRKANVQVLQEQLTSQLTVRHLTDLTDFYYACAIKFSKNGTSAKTFDGENVNGVVGTAARNVPEHSTSTNCTYTPVINCGVLQHLATSLLVVACGIFASLL